MKVNMTPNPLDVVTIHASQGDTEARQWEFELHNNGEKIDSSSISDQLVFKAYKGGTEQLLPENTNTPTTSPFLGDIRYPQGLLTDQEFTYRQSPTEEDGNAKITDIKGNTLVWNQLIENGNFADTSKWSAESGATLSISNNIATISSTTASNGIRQYLSNSLTVNHKYLVKAEFNVPTEYRCVIGTGATQGLQIEKLISTANTWTEVSGIGTCTASTTAFYCFVRGTTYENVKIRNVMFFDLTAMGLDISNPSDFTSLFPLSYYSYNQGSLLSFNGNGIKTVGKNLFNARNTYTENGITFTNNNGVITINGTATRNTFFTTNIGLRNGSYFIGAFNDEINNSVHVACQTKGGAYALDAVMSVKNRVVSINNDINNFIIWVNSGTTLNNFVLKPMVSFDSPEYFEPYTESTLSLPISTYFPTGMKSAGSVYDELTETKAITRIGSRAYQNGDESDTSVITDGTTTFYPLATPTETSFSTASLVTENAEIPLSNEDGVLIGKCTEQLSNESGFFDAKIKLADDDGECYSNKIQLHVERSPQ